MRRQQRPARGPSGNRRGTTPFLGKRLESCVPTGRVRPSRPNPEHRIRRLAPPPGDPALSGVRHPHTRCRTESPGKELARGGAMTQPLVRRDVAGRGRRPPRGAPSARVEEPVPAQNPCPPAPGADPARGGLAARDSTTDPARCARRAPPRARSPARCRRGRRAHFRTAAM